MIDTGLFLPIRFYSNHTIDDLSQVVTAAEQVALGRGECSHFRNHREYFCAEAGWLPPFQIPAHIDTPSATFELVNCKGDETPLSLMFSTDQIEIDGEDVVYTTFNGGSITDVPEGLYMINISDIYLSDPIYFKSTESLRDLIYIKYKGMASKMMGDIYWRPDFEPFVWVNTFIEKPEYPILNETRQDGDGDEHHVFQRWAKRRRISFKGVESMADAMSMLPLMEEVYVLGQRVYDPVVNISWEDEYACLADIEISFLTKKVVRSF